MRVECDTASPCTVVLDHAFNVRGVGTVALGFVRRGVPRVHDELRFLPLGTVVTVRSIQRFDEDQMEALAGARVGVALKGIEADEIDRGSLLTADATIASSPRLVIAPFSRGDFAKDPLAAGTKGLHVTAGLFTRPVVVDEVGASCRVTADRALPILRSETAFLTILRGPGSLRVLGRGPLSR